MTSHAPDNPTPLGPLPAGLSEDALIAYLDGDLSPEDAGRVQNALAADPAWARVVAGMRADGASLRDLGRADMAMAVRPGLVEAAIAVHLEEISADPLTDGLPDDVLASISSPQATPDTVVVRARGSRPLPLRTLGWALAATVIGALGLGVWVIADRIGQPTGAAGLGGDVIADAGTADDSAGTMMMPDPRSADARMARNAEASPLARAGAGGSEAEGRVDSSATIRLASPDEIDALARAGRLVIIARSARPDAVRDAWLNAQPTARFRVEDRADRWSVDRAHGATGRDRTNTLATLASFDTSALADTLVLAADDLARPPASPVAPNLTPDAFASADGSDPSALPSARRRARVEPEPGSIALWTARLDPARGAGALEQAANHRGVRLVFLALGDEPAGGRETGAAGADVRVPVAPRGEDLLWWTRPVEDWPESGDRAWLDVPLIVELRD